VLHIAERDAEATKAAVADLGVDVSTATAKIVTAKTVQAD
jgi:hypothetical protein